MQGYQKQVVADKVKKHADDDKKFTILTATPQEEELIILFRSVDDAKKARRIEKLSTTGLPGDEGGFTGIVWINNFWLKNDKDQDLNGVPYRVQLKSRSGKTLVYHDGVSVKAYNGAVTQLGDGRIEIELSIGDPAAGWGGSG